MTHGRELRLECLRFGLESGRGSLLLLLRRACYATLSAASLLTILINFSVLFAFALPLLTLVTPLLAFFPDNLTILTPSRHLLDMCRQLSFTEAYPFACPCFESIAQSADFIHRPYF